MMLVFVKHFALENDHLQSAVAISRHPSSVLSFPETQPASAFLVLATTPSGFAASGLASVVVTVVVLPQAAADVTVVVTVGMFVSKKGASNKAKLVALAGFPVRMLEMMISLFLPKVTKRSKSHTSR